MPPLTRTALLSSLTAFILALILFRPGAPSHGRAPQAAAVAQLLPLEDPLAQRTLLLDESLAFLPQFGSLVTAGGEFRSDVDGAPFSPFPPRLRFELGRNPDLPLETDFSKFSSPQESFKPEKGDLLRTFSSTKAPLSSIKPRSFRCEVTPLGEVSPKPFFLEMVDFPNIYRPKSDLFEFKAIMGVDSLGIIGKPTIITPSGDASWDSAAVSWICAQSWEGKLPPGVFQISVGP